MLEELSDSLLRWGLSDTWRSIFAGDNSGCVEFRQRSFTVLCSELPDDSSGEAMLRVIARRYAAAIELRGELPLAMAFEQPGIALSAAIALQRLTQGKRLRTGIRIWTFDAALIMVERQPLMLLLGDIVGKAERVAQMSSPGTIHIAPETYRILGAELATAASSAMVMTEIYDDEVSSATLILPPAVASEPSTFAGLGLT
jgi:hypothetical protein